MTGSSRKRRFGGIGALTTLTFRSMRSVISTAASPRIGLLDGAPTALFQTVTQVGGTYQHVLGAWILKCEGGWRFFESIAAQSGLALLSEGTGKPNHGRLALGLEYGTSLASGAESTLILEGQTILGTTRAEALELDLFQGDVLLGYRYAFNDVDSKALLVSVIVDVEDPESSSAVHNTVRGLAIRGRSMPA